jgi:release factor glutamine methyltransferase
LHRLGADQELRWILEEAAGENWPLVAGRPAPGRAVRRFEEMVTRRAAGEPLQYVLGHWPFRSLDLMVDRRVLIPRPETEQVVEVALAEYDRLALGDKEPDPVLVDLGTGSGAIALSLAAERRAGRIWATDNSPEALAVAWANLAGLGGSSAARVLLAHGSWWCALPDQLRGRIDLVVTNPPYIAPEEAGSVDVVVARWEPHHALFAPAGGLQDVHEVLGPAPEWLNRPASLVMEVAAARAEVCRELALGAGFDEAEVLADLAGRPRVLVARLVNRQADGERPE